MVSYNAQSFLVVRILILIRWYIQYTKYTLLFSFCLCFICEGTSSPTRFDSISFTFSSPFTLEKLTDCRWILFLMSFFHHTHSKFTILLLWGRVQWLVSLSRMYQSYGDNYSSEGLQVWTFHWHLNPLSFTKNTLYK